MKIWYVAVIAALLALISVASAQNPIESFAGSLQSQAKATGEQLQQKAVQHIAEGNLTQEHIAQDFNKTAENLTEKAKQELGQKLNQNLNISPAELEQRAKEELKNQLNQKLKQQPGFPAALAALAIFAAVCLIKRRD
jgi:fatty acid-binding protein DegV